MNIHLNNRPILNGLGTGLILSRSTANAGEALISVSSIRLGK
jgi:hypothetical protein